MDVQSALAWDKIEKQSRIMQRIIKSLRGMGSDLSYLKPILVNNRWSDADLDRLIVMLLHDTPKSEECELCIQFVEALTRVPKGSRENYRAIAVSKAMIL